MTDAYNTPNVVIPLALSYDTRNVHSNTAVLAGYDQRKINSFYDLVKNAVGGNTTLELVKRPGVTQINASSGDPSVPPYLVATNPSAGGVAFSPVMVLYVNGSDVKCDASTVVSSSGAWPMFIDATAISAVWNAVLQVATDAAGASSAYFSTDGATWTLISTSNYTGLAKRGKLENLQGWALQLAGDGYIYNSNVNSLANWTAGDRIQKAIQQDQPRGLAKFKTQILAFGDETCEVFENNGNPSGSPLRTVPAAEARYGLGYLSSAGFPSSGQRHYYALVGERLYFVGRQAGGTVARQVFAYNGSSFDAVSNGAIDRIIGEATVYSVTRVGFYGQSALAIELTAPTVTSASRWLMFFPKYNEWFEWTSDVFSPVNSGAFFLGLNTAAKVYAFSATETWKDDQTAYTMTTQFQMPSKGNNRKLMNWCGLDADTTASTSNVGVSYNDNDSGTTFTTPQNIDLSTSDKRITRQGSYAQRLVRLTHSANVECRMRNFLARIG